MHIKYSRKEENTSKCGPVLQGIDTFLAKDVAPGNVDGIFNVALAISMGASFPRRCSIKHAGREVERKIQRVN